MSNCTPKSFSLLVFSIRKFPIPIATNEICQDYFSSDFHQNIKTAKIFTNSKKYYVDGIYNRRKNFEHSCLKKVNDYNLKIKLTIEVSSAKFLDTSLNLNNGIYDFKVYRKTTKQPTHCSSKISKRYKHNMVLGDLH